MTELQAMLRHRPPDRRPALRQAELALASAKKDLYWATHRLDAVQNQLRELGRFSQLRRHGRNEKASVLDQIDRFTDDVRTAEAKIARCHRGLEEFRPEVDQRSRWDADHNWPESRLRQVDLELAELGRPGRQIGGQVLDDYLLSRAPGRERLGIDRAPEIALPPLPGPDLGAGLDLGP